MKKFTKLALISSMAISANAMAMQAMDDSALSATTGQDGINIGIGISRVTIDKLFVHDNDGLAEDATNTYIPMNPGTPASAVSNPISGGSGDAGAIVIQGVTDPTRARTITLTSLNNAGTNTISNANQAIFIGANYSDGGAYLLNTGNLADLQIDADGSADGAFLNIAAQVSGLEIHIGEIGVAESNTYTAGAVQRGAKLTGNDKNYNAILSGLSIKTGQMSANVQLGAAPQGAMIKLDTTMIGGLVIEGLGILDNSTAGDAVAAGVTTDGPGEIYIESIKVTDANSANLKIKQDVQVFGSSTANKGFIKITSDSGAHDIYVKGVHLGSYTRPTTATPNPTQSTSIGDIEIRGMQTFHGTGYTPGSVLTISGH
ncbi:putative pilus system protein FilA [Acinetobacter schindleri]|uniref:putative pilus system protein FilA n=1 Tax=Acinetobacter schindleri TaxID=108981 RepID=UPI003F55FF55